MELSYKNNQKSLFRKYAKLVTWFANTQLGRDYLKHNNFSIPSEKLGLLLPNGYIRQEGNQAQMVVTTRAVYAPRLYPALQMIDGLQTTLQETRELLLWYLGLRFQPAWATNRLLSTLVVYPDGNPESTSVDGYVTRSNGGAYETWAVLRAGAGTGHVDTDVIIYVASQSSNGVADTYLQLGRGIILFDTSAFPSNGTLTVGANTVAMTQQTTYTTENHSLVLSTPASNTVLANSDYGQTGTTKQATDVSNPGTFTLNTTGEGNLAIPGGLGAGITKFAIKMTRDNDNSAPTWETVKDYGCIYHSSDAGSNRPTLTLTYTLPARPYSVSLIGGPGIVEF